jgi:transmembrane sensor
MTSPILDPHNPHHPDYQLGLEASQWLVQFSEPPSDPDDPYFDSDKRSEAFMEWLLRSPAHVAMFLETYETYQRLGNIDPKGRIKIDELLAARNADVIQLFGPTPTPIQHPPWWRRAAALGLVAAAATVILGSVIAVKMSNAHAFATAVGEQRTCKLEDGSFIYLNTDTQVKVDFTKGRRHIELIRGEALFAVEHDPHRPFVVTANGTNIRAVGTQFNVRRRDASTDVAVVEGVVQVTTALSPDPSATNPALSVPEAASPVHSVGAFGKTPAPMQSVPSTGGSNDIATTRLAAGEEVSVAGGHVKKQVQANVAEALSWRQRRLIFNNTPFAEVAAEFNRYNVRQIHVEGSVAMELSGAFDADRPNVLVLYAMKHPNLTAQPDGDNWIIRAK